MQNRDFYVKRIDRVWKYINMETRTFYLPASKNIFQRNIQLHLLSDRQSNMGEDVLILARHSQTELFCVWLGVLDASSVIC